MADKQQQTKGSDLEPGDLRDVPATPHDWEELSPNLNNARVEQRLVREKQQLMGRIQNTKDDGGVSYSRAGSPMNPGDLSSPGLGGDLGVSPAIIARGDSEDAAQHAAAQAAADRAAAASDSLAGDTAWGRPQTATAAAESGLLDTASDAAPAAKLASPGGGWTGTPVTVKTSTKADAVAAASGDNKGAADILSGVASGNGGAASGNGGTT